MVSSYPTSRGFVHFVGHLATYLSNKVQDGRTPSNEAFNDIVPRCVEYKTRLMRCSMKQIYRISV